MPVLASLTLRRVSEKEPWLFRLVHRVYRPLLRVRLDRNKMARYGIRANDALDVIETIGGKRVGTVFERQERYALQLRFDKNVRDDRDGIGKLRVSSRDEGGHNLIPLAQLATVGSNFLKVGVWNGGGNFKTSRRRRNV